MDASKHRRPWIPAAAIGVLAASTFAFAFPPPTPPDPAAKLKQYDSLWKDLAGEEVPATRALLKLSAIPDDVALFAAKLTPFNMDEKVICYLLKDFNSDKDDVSKKAYETPGYTSLPIPI